LKFLAYLNQYLSLIASIFPVGCFIFFKQRNMMYHSSLLTGCQIRKVKNSPRTEDLIMNKQPSHASCTMIFQHGISVELYSLSISILSDVKIVVPQI
jgi:hypothetical protein